MKLSTDLVEQTLSQYNARVIPENHPVVPELNEMFGEHTFFVDREGLSILEPVDPPQQGAEACKVVKLAEQYGVTSSIGRLQKALDGLPG